MKGLLKGFRLIHDIFDEKEQEMQIGQPTDVKHVAHIGMDGPVANKPTWMSGFNSAQELSSDTLVNDLQDGDLGGLVAGNPESLPPVEKQKKTRRKASTENGTAVESSEGGEKAEKHRRHRSSNHSTESAGGESSSHGRRHHSSRSTGGESLSNDVPDAPKKPRRKKTKDSDGGSSTRSKTASLPDAAEAELES